MKKILSIAICLGLLLTLSVVAGAETYHCPDHPNAGVSEISKNIKSVSQFSVVQHRFSGFHYYTCQECGRVLWDDSEYEIHTLNGSTCSKCGFQRASKEELAKEADYLVYQDNIYNHACWVMYDGMLQSEPNSGARQLTGLSFGEAYYVEAYEQIGDALWIQLKKLPSDAPIGWYPANQLYIDPTALTGATGYEIGRTIYIITSSGRGRADAGTEFPYIETVHNGEKYIVLDAKTGTNGNAWYKISVNGQEVWISSGITSLN